MKSGRQRQIIAIITENQVETQTELLTRLRLAGYNATQATVSRDIKELKLIKISTADGHYQYAVSPSEETKQNAKFDNILKETVVDVHQCGNLVVVRTYEGMAMAAAAAIDNLHMSCICGTIAGDDTIFVAVADQDSGELIEQKFSSIIRNR